MIFDKLKNGPKQLRKSCSLKISSRFKRPPSGVTTHHFRELEVQTIFDSMKKNGSVQLRKKNRSSGIPSRFKRPPGGVMTQKLGKSLLAKQNAIASITWSRPASFEGAGRRWGAGLGQRPALGVVGVTDVAVDEGQRGGQQVQRGPQRRHGNGRRATLAASRSPTPKEKKKNNDEQRPQAAGSAPKTCTCHRRHNKQPKKGNHQPTIFRFHSSLFGSNHTKSGLRSGARTLPSCVPSFSFFFGPWFTRCSFWIKPSQSNETQTEGLRFEHNRK